MPKSRVLRIFIVLLFLFEMKASSLPEDAVNSNREVKILELESEIAQLKLENHRLKEKYKNMPEERENCTGLFEQTNYITESLKAIQTDVKPLKAYMDAKYKSNASQSSNNADNRIKQLSRENESVNLTALAAEVNLISQSFKTGLEKILTNLQANEKEKGSNAKCTPSAPFKKIGYKYYYISKEKLNWFAAAEKCRRLDGHLVNVESEEEYDLIVDELKKLKGDHYWMSGNDLAKEGTQISIATGKPLTYTRWYNKEPNNYGKNEHCLEISMIYKYEMNDYDCKTAYQFICEAALPKI